MSLFSKIKRLFRKKHSACSIGIIGGADGPTAFFIADKPNDNGITEEWIDKMASTTTPCKKAIQELEAYLMKHYHAKEIELIDRKRDFFKANMIQNYCPELLKTPLPNIELLVNSSKEELENYANMQSLRFDEALSFPEDKTTLDIHQYEFTLNVENVPSATALVSIERLNEVAQLSLQTDAITPHKEQDRLIKIIQNLSDEMTLFQGISQQDIDERSTRFMIYLLALKNKDNKLEAHP